MPFLLYSDDAVAEFETLIADVDLRARTSFRTSSRLLLPKEHSHYARRCQRSLPHRLRGIPLPNLLDRTAHRKTSVREAGHTL